MTTIQSKAFRCSSCSGLFSRVREPLSRARKTIVRSDAKDMSFVVTTLVACPRCGQAMDLLSTALRQESVRNERLDPSDQYIGQMISALEAQYEAQPIPLSIEATLQQWMDWSKSFDTKYQRAKDVQIQTWHRINDDRERSSGREFSASETQYLESLLRLIENDSDIYLWLAKAEILRELGRFDEAAAALERDLHGEFTARAEQLMVAIEARSRDLFVFESAEDDEDTDFKWAWMLRRYKARATQDLSNSYEPCVFNISNRDWWVRVQGMSSHEWALIDSNADGSCTAYFFLGDGRSTSMQRKDRSKHQVKSAIVDSLTFESIASASKSLNENCFYRLETHNGPWVAHLPEGLFYDARAQPYITQNWLNDVGSFVDKLRVDSDNSVESKTFKIFSQDRFVRVKKSGDSIS